MSTMKVTVYGNRSREQAARASRSGRLKIANQIAAEASGVAPRRTGTFAASFTVSDTSGVRVHNTDPTAIHKEYGTSKTPAHATLTSVASRYGRYRGTRPR